MKKSAVLMGFFALIISLSFASAATYYISPSGSDTTGTGTSASPWSTLTRAFTGMAGGDTLIIRNGTYTGDLNRLTSASHPPYGSSSAWTIIKAEYDGGAFFDGENARDMFYFWGPGSIQTPVYWQFEGLIWGRTSSNNVGFFYGSYAKFLRCGGFDAGSDNSANFGIGRAANYVLLENCYAWGNGRYKFSSYLSDHIIYRQCVGRLDRTVTTGPIGVMAMYSTNNSLVQNCIAIDSDQDNFFTGGIEMRHGSFFTPSTNFNSHNVTFTHSIALNNKLGGLHTTNDPGSDDITFSNMAVWNCNTGGNTSTATINNLRGDRTKLVNCTLGMSKIASGYYYHIRSDGLTPSIRNTILYNFSGGYAMRGISPGEDYNSFYGNSANNYDGALGSHSLSSINPLINSLRYIPRIESGSNLSSKGENGADIGANILKKIGVSGTLWGEPGYNTDTGISMWPFPNEALIKSKMNTYSYTGPQVNGSIGTLSGNRGFAANGNGLYGGPITLTSYIWEYLGNPCPSEICNYTQTNQTQNQTNQTQNQTNQTNQTVYHESDLNQNSYIETSEIMTYISRFKTGNVTRTDVLIGVRNWLLGRYQ